MTYRDIERERQAGFKQAWRLPAGARENGRYGKKLYTFVLPAEYARENLWDPIRDAALEHFHAHKIKWHDGRNKGPAEQRSPSQHLLDSQVCAVNFWWGLGRSPFRDQGRAAPTNLAPLEFMLVALADGLNPLVHKLACRLSSSQAERDRGRNRERSAKHRERDDDYLISYPHLQERHRTRKHQNRGPRNHRQQRGVYDAGGHYRAHCQVRQNQADGEDGQTE